MRFNLHIRHVHRGLLLGTGPLVDPGYWGKLCIPLHNLTDKDYPIPKDEGLIWMEFTKISSSPTQGEYPGSRGFWGMRQFITRAASQYGNVAVPVRSSIPVAIKEAQGSVKSAEKSAKSAERKVVWFSRIGYSAGIVAFFTLLFAFGALVYTAYDNAETAYHALGSGPIKYVALSGDP